MAPNASLVIVKVFSTLISNLTAATITTTLKMLSYHIVIQIQFLISFFAYKIHPIHLTY